MPTDHKLQITTSNPMFGLYLYPESNLFREKQQDIMWTAQEIPVENDINDYKQHMDEHQFQLVSLTLQLFVEIEQKVGDVWEQVAKWFPHSEIEGACVQIAAMEKSVHAFFYQKMNDTLAIEPQDIAKNQETVAVLKNKLLLLDSITANLSDNYVLSLYTVSMIEQVLLFSNFAMLKSFKANGHNLIQNTLTGVDFVVQDETIHGLFAGYLYTTYLSELKEAITEEEYSTFMLDLGNKQTEVANEIINHEVAVINYLYNDITYINDISADNLINFVYSRANEVIKTLDANVKQFTIDETVNTIPEWFYKGASAIKMHDFFIAGTNQYRRSWQAEKLSLFPYITGALNEQ